MSGALPGGNGRPLHRGDCGWAGEQFARDDVLDEAIERGKFVRVQQRMQPILGSGVPANQKQAARLSVVFLNARSFRSLRLLAWLEVFIEPIRE